MSRDEFVMLVRDSNLVDRRLTGEVRELIEIFPYFQSAHLLLLKGLQNTSDIKFQNQLTFSAVHIANREVLYHLLVKIDQKQPGQPEPAAETVEGGNSEAVIVLSSTIRDEIMEQEMSPEIFQTDETVHEEEMILMNNTVTEPALSGSDTSDLLELDYSDEGQETSADNEYLVTGSADKPVNGSSGEKQSQSELIDKFILANPRIEPVREKSDAPLVDISKPFVEDKDSFVTETLAKIYLNQHYYSRAIDIYEKLTLKFPEKSSYFAGQIEKIKALIK
jgi:hypothetical protein